MADEIRFINVELLTINIAQIAKKCARSDAQKALIGRVLFMIENMPTIEAEPVGWISVKDRVPEAGVNVLVTDGIHAMVTWCEYINNQCLWVDNFYEYVNVRFGEVTHWMPLPELPKEDNNDKDDKR